MPQNRIIHNVQDVFVGSTSNEKDILITGIAGHQVLKRLNRVQSFNYSIEMPPESASVLGRSMPFSRSYVQPPSVSLSISYTAAGIDNEKRIGLNTDNENENAYDKDKCLVHDMVTRTDSEVSASTSNDARNIYLIVNSKNEDIHKNRNISYSGLYHGAYTENDIIDKDSPDYNVVVFQNCYLNSYKLQIAAGSLATVDLDYDAGNIVGYSSGSGVNIPYLDTAAGTTVDTIDAIYTSDFSSPDDWGQTGIVSTYFSKEIVTLHTSDVDESHYMYRDTLVSGAKYRAEGEIYIDSDNDKLKKIKIHGDGHHWPRTDPRESPNTYLFSADDAGWTSFSFDFIALHPLFSFHGTTDNDDYSFIPSNGPGNFGGDIFKIKNVVVKEIKEFIIPEYQTRKEGFFDEGFLSHPGNIIISITSSSNEESVENFLDDSITSCDISFTLERVPVDRVGHKLIADRLVRIPMKSTLSFGTLVKEDLNGTFLDNMDKSKDYNITVELKYDPKILDADDTAAIYTFSGAKFNGVSYSSTIGSNKTAQVNFSTYMDLENKTAGLFVSGKLSSMFGDVVIGDGTTSVIDNNENEVISAPIYPSY